MTSKISTGNSFFSQAENKLQNNQVSARQIKIQNICNQIKYIVEGNLKGQNAQTIVRDSIIPMLIKIFFGNKNSLNSIDKQNLAPSSFIQNLSKFSLKGKNIRRNLESTIHNVQINSTCIDPIQSNVNLDILKQSQNLISSTIYFALIMLKISLNRKYSSLNLIKQFTKHKQQKTNNFVYLLQNYQQTKIKQAFRKLQTQYINDKYICNLQKQKKLFQKNKKQEWKLRAKQIFVKNIIKILKLKIKFTFNQFKTKSLEQNSFKNSWVLKAALSSPLTIKTSIWRFKKYGQEYDKELNNKVQQKYEQIQNKNIKYEILQKDQNIQHNKQSVYSENYAADSQKSLPQQNISIKNKKEEKLLSNTERQQSLSPSQFDRMFQDEYQQVQIIRNQLNVFQKSLKFCEQRQSSPRKICKTERSADQILATITQSQSEYTN